MKASWWDFMNCQWAKTKTSCGQLVVILGVYGLFGPLASWAQSPYFRHITDREGLPSMTVYHIHQDQQGYIWLGTEAGIYRYDGIHFKHFESPGSKGKACTAIQEDSQGNIYFINFAGQLYQLNKNSKVPKLLSSEPHHIIITNYLIDHQDNLWACDKRVYRKKKGSKVWQATERFKQGPRSIQKDQLGNIWVITADYVYQLNDRLQITQVIKCPTRINKVIFFENKILILSLRYKNFHQYDFTTGVWESTLDEVKRQIPDKIAKLLLDEQQNFWVLTYSGVVQGNYHENTFQKVLLRGKFISDYLQDREGNRWFTTIGQGIYVLPNTEGLHFNKENSPLTSEQVNCLVEDHQGNLYVGTSDNQLFYLDTKQQQLQPGDTLSEGYVECLWFDKAERKLYVENHKVQVYDEAIQQWLPPLVMGNTPKAMRTYRGQYLITAAGDGTYLVNLKEATAPTFKYFGYLNLPQQRFKSFVLASRRARALEVDESHQRIWVAYLDGLFYHDEQGHIQEVKTVDGQSIIAHSIRIDHEGIIWVGTIQQGIFAIQNKQVTMHLNQQKGLISNSCRVVRDQQFLYIGTNLGLQVYHLTTKQSRVFNQEDGLPSNEVNDLLIQLDKIYLATNAVLSVLNKYFSTTNDKPPLIYLTGMDIWDQPQALQPQYTLAHHQNNLTIYFTGLAFRSAGKFAYKYRLRGLHNRWTHVKSSNNFARYAALSPGKYIFEVKSINEDHIESTQTATLVIEVAYPFWQKWWFLVMVILVSGGVIGVVFINRVRAIQRKNEMEKALGKATLESLKLQMNPHFLFGSMGAIQRYMSHNDSQTASNYLIRFAKLMRAVLENSRSEYISLEAEIEMLENYLTLQSLKQRGRFRYHIEVAEALDTEEIAIPPMFAQPFVENAIEHGIADVEQGVIEIYFDLEAEFVVLKIIDNGIGFEKSKAQKQATNHRSLSLEITRERLALYQKSLKLPIRFDIESAQNGTCVIFHLPYQNL